MDAFTNSPSGVSREIRDYPSLRACFGVLQKWLRRQLGRRMAAALLLALGVHGFAAAGCGLWSLHSPFSRAALVSAAWSYLVYLAAGLPLAAWITEGGRRLPRAARLLDRENPELPDPFQTLLSMRNHSATTRQALDSLYLAMTPRLRVPRLRIPGRYWSAAAAGVCAWAVAGAVSRDWTGYAGRSVWPWNSLAEIPHLEIRLEAERNVLGRGDTAVFRGDLRNFSMGQRMYVFVQSGETLTRYPLTVEDGGFEFRKGPLDADIGVWAQAANGMSREVRVRVLPRPKLRRLQAIVTPPEYTRHLPDTLPAGSARFNALLGSRVNWLVETDRELLSIRMHVFGGDREEARAPAARLGAAHAFALDLTPPTQKSGRDSGFAPPFEYAFDWVDEHGISGTMEPRGRVGLQPDLIPQLQVHAPQDGDLIGREGSIGVSLSLEDDFGFSYLGLGYTLSSDGILKDSGSVGLSEWLPSHVLGAVRERWDVSEMELRPDNQLVVRWTVCDNDQVSGPKCAQSPDIRLRYPSIREIAAQVERAGTEVEANLRSAAAVQKQVMTRAERLLNPDPSTAMPAPGYEVRRILVDNPRRIAAGAERLEVPSDSKGNKDAGRGSRYERWRRRIQSYAKRLPQPEITSQGPREQMNALALLEREHERLRESLGSLMSAPSSQQNPESLPRNLERLAAEMERQEGEQSRLREYLEAEIQRRESLEAQRDKLMEDQAAAVREIRRAEEDLAELLEQARQTQLYDSEILDKMNRIRDLIREVVPDSLVELMQRRMQGEPVEWSQVERGLREIMDNREGFEQNLDWAIAGLERMRVQQRLAEAGRSLEELARKEAALSKGMENPGNTPAKTVVEAQSAIRGEAGELLREAREAAGKIRGESEFAESLDAGRATGPMKRAEDLLSAKNPDWSGGAGQAQKASAALLSMAESLAALAQEGAEEGGLDAKALERLVLESIHLTELQSLVRDGNAAGRGWAEDRNQVYASALQIAKWIHEEIKTMEADNPFVTSFLVSEARQLENALAHRVSRGEGRAGEAARRHNLNVTRELLKLLKLAKSPPPSGGQGQGQGGMSGSQGAGGAQGKDIASELKGISGRQMAINQATNRLLQSMLEGRSASPSPGPGETGMGESAGEMANRQGGVGEALESMAESADEGGGAATKLRRLAQEARRLEEAIRHRSRPAELNRDQERFRTRLLEAARSLRERGESSQRRGRVSGRDFAEPPAPSAEALARWRKLVQREQASIDGKDWREIEKASLQKYYRDLLAR